jgi:hypothetical protein
LTGCGSLQWRWLRFDVIQDLLDYVWASDVGDDAHGATKQTKRTHTFSNVLIISRVSYLVSFWFVAVNRF